MPRKREISAESQLIAVHRSDVDYSPLTVSHILYSWENVQHFIGECEFIEKLFKKLKRDKKERLKKIWDDLNKKKERYYIYIKKAVKRERREEKIKNDKSLWNIIRLVDELNNKLKE